MSSQNNDTIKAESDHFQRTFRATNITQLLFLGEKSTQEIFMQTTHFIKYSNETHSHKMFPA